MRDVLGRFFANLELRLISAGSNKQTASGLNSQTLQNLLGSSKPDWLIVGIGLADALREPAIRRAIQSAPDSHSKRLQEEAESAFGPELRVRRQDPGPVSDVGVEPEPTIENLAFFESDLRAALGKLVSAGINVAVLTTVILGKNPQDIANRVLRSYNRAIRAAAQEHGVLLIDIEKAFKDVIDRGLNYKQSVALAGATGELNAQGQALLARTVLHGLGLLPQAGWRPLR